MFLWAWWVNFHGCTLYLHFNVILQLSIQEVEGNRFLEFRILWKRWHFSLKCELIRTLHTSKPQQDQREQNKEESFNFGLVVWLEAKVTCHNLLWYHSSKANSVEKLKSSKRLWIIIIQSASLSIAMPTLALYCHHRKHIADYILYTTIFLNTWIWSNPWYRNIIIPDASLLATCMCNNRQLN